MFNEDTLEKLLISAAQKVGWTYIDSEMIPRSLTQPFVEPWLKEAILCLNPEVSSSQADQVIYKLRAVWASMNGASELITANQQLFNLLLEQNSYPFKKDGGHVNIRFFNFEHPEKNKCVITNQWSFANEGTTNTKRFDVVLLINGLPLVIGELKTPVRPAITWADGAEDIRSYEKSVPAMFVSNVLNFASEGKAFRYGSIGAPIDKWSPWHQDGIRTEGQLADVERSFKNMITPHHILDIMRFFVIFATNKKHQKIKVVCRYQQYEGANAIVNRVVENRIRKGLIWHFQGSGKSLLMVFAAQKLRKQPELKNPTVVIVDDRIDLEKQITADFMSADIPNIAGANSKEELEKFFKNDQRMILITTIFKFGDVTGELNSNENIILMVDEAHRTQEGHLGEKMRRALPNAFFFGLTGTPINRHDHNTFALFGAEEDEGHYMSKYSFQNSIDDHATLELKFKTVLPELKINKEVLDKEFEELTSEKGLTEAEKDNLVSHTKTEALFTAPARIQKVCEHIVSHFKTYIEPTGMKAQVVVFNRWCCLEYKKQIDSLLGNTENTTIVMDANGGDKADLFKPWKRDAAEEQKVLDRFRDPLDPLKIVIVTSKLLTGFDAPILQCMYLDKPMKNHTLLQAICRTNRVYDAQKTHGLIVDYVGVFDDVARALAYDDESIKKVISNLKELKDKIPYLMKDCLDYFPGIDRTISDFDTLIAAQQKLDSQEKCDQFAARFSVLHRAWEAVSPDSELQPYENDYVWLSQIYQSVKPVGTDGSLLWKILGPKTIELIHRNVETVDIGTTLEDLVLNTSVLDTVLDEASAKKKVREVEQMLRLRLKKHAGDPKFKKLAEKVEELRERMRQNLINNIEFLKGLLDAAKEMLELEKEEPEDNRAKARAALTELFSTVKTDSTPLMVERIVNDIDESVVRIVRNFQNAFKLVAGKREVQQQLRSILWLKYKIKDEEVFDKAYKYVEMYY